MGDCNKFEDKNWISLKREMNTEIWEGSLNIQPYFGRENKICLLTKHNETDSKYDVLLEYKI